jgi:flagellar M-ring protein FliF
VAGGVITAVNSSDVTQSVRNESKTFAVSKTSRHTVQPPGQLKRLSAAVLVDDVVETKDAGGKPQETRRKRTMEEMAQLEALTKAALGFNSERGDELSIQNIAFQVPTVEPVTPPTRVQRTVRVLAPFMGVLRYAGLALLFIVIYLLVLRPVKKQVVATLQALPQASQPATLGTTTRAELPGKPGRTMADMEGALAQELSATDSEVMRAVVLKRHLVDKVRKEPAGASRLIQSWVRQDTVRS